MNILSFRQLGHLRAAKWSASLLGCATAMFLGACSSAPAHYHSLTPIHQTIGPPPQSDSGTIACTPDATGPNAPEREPIGTVLLTHLAVPVEADRMQLLLHQTPTRLSVYETERWAAPLGDQISFILIDNLRNALPDLNITSDPLLVGRGTPLQLNMDIEELDALAGKEAIVRARWRWSVADKAASQTGICTARQPLRSTGIDELVLAWSRALADISSALAASIQQNRR
ncbi:MAG: membrane integrity-associated transporter subunit PqiC [Steroidobacteraceae bacterium]